jgi:hypothetical protein
MGHFTFVTPVVHNNTLFNQYVTAAMATLRLSGHPGTLQGTQGKGVPVLN